jgi:hypothetical protein
MKKTGRVIVILLWGLRGAVSEHLRFALKLHQSNLRVEPLIIVFHPCMYLLCLKFIGLRELSKLKANQDSLQDSAGFTGIGIGIAELFMNHGI